MNTHEEIINLKKTDVHILMYENDVNSRKLKLEYTSIFTKLIFKYIFGIGINPYYNKN